QRDERQGLRADAGHLPRPGPGRAGGEHRGGYRLRHPRSPHSSDGGLTMTSLSPRPATEEPKSLAPQTGIGSPETASVLAAGRPHPEKATFWSQLKGSLAMFSNPKSAAGLIILGVFVLVAIFAPLIA